MSTAEKLDAEQQPHSVNANVDFHFPDGRRYTATLILEVIFADASIPCEISKKNSFQLMTEKGIRISKDASGIEIMNLAANLKEHRCPFLQVDYVLHILSAKCSDDGFFDIASGKRVSGDQEAVMNKAFISNRLANKFLAIKCIMDMQQLNSLLD